MIEHNDDTGHSHFYLTAKGNPLTSDQKLSGEGLTPVTLEKFETIESDLVKAAEARSNTPERIAARRTEIFDSVFLRFVGSYSIKGSYPNKQAAMDKAVATLPETATADELFDAAVSALGD